jgi:hypothetical protein
MIDPINLVAWMKATSLELSSAQSKGGSVRNFKLHMYEHRIWMTFPPCSHRCFRTILTKVTFVTSSVAYLMIDPTCFVLEMPLGTFIFLHVLVKCHLEAFVALS